MWNWRPWSGVVGALALAAGLWLVPASPLDVTAPATACAAAVILWTIWPRGHGAFPWVSSGVGLVSIAVTVISVSTRVDSPPEPEFNASLWVLLEPVVLVVFVYLPVRWSPPGRAGFGAGVAGVAVALSVQRYMPWDDHWWEYVAGSALWLVPSLTVGFVAWYLRGLETQRHRAVADARQAQRMDLASDLHDFVAHDVSEIVAQAQASRMVLAVGNPGLDRALERIERAGLRALESMDRTVHMLRDSGSARGPIGGIADLATLVERFGASGSTRARLMMGESPAVPREPGAVVYRVVAEALTNVRRHATQAASVDVTVEVTASAVRVTVDDDGLAGARTSSRDRGGLGIPGLTERVESLGGSLSAGPRSPRGWRLSAFIPLSANDD
ncbi:sensor histidine kinase [Stackebrandtia soli]|uniref:sensor histidine kinase n=1 Tax=Stackebrandtia soli TaxID=1892856 RepID=UPI0039EB664E